MNVGTLIISSRIFIVDILTNQTLIHALQVMELIVKRGENVITIEDKTTYLGLSIKKSL